MRTISAMLALFLSAALIEDAWAAPPTAVVQQLQDLCIGTGAEPARVLTKARAAGWTRDGQVVGSRDVIELRRRASDQFEQRLILDEQVGWVGRQKVSWRQCTLHSNDNLEAVRSDLEQYVGFRPHLYFDGATEWVIAANHGHFNDLFDLSSWVARDALKHGPVRTITAAAYDGAVVVTYAQTRR